MSDWDAETFEPLIQGLASEDAFTRLEAIEKLESLTHLTFGFRFNDPAELRNAALQRWRAWMEDQKRDRETDQKLKTAIELSGGVIDLNALKSAMKEIPADKIQGYLHALILKMKAQQHRCQACDARPATVRVTEIHEGECRTVHLCDHCARERGDPLV